MSTGPSLHGSLTATRFLNHYDYMERLAYWQLATKSKELLRLVSIEPMGTWLNVENVALAVSAASKSDSRYGQ